MPIKGLTSPVSSEHRLLLDCARTSIGDEVGERIKQFVRSDLNWAHIKQTASWHGVLPLVCYNLNRLCSDAVPPDVLRDLQGRFRENSVHNLTLAAELLKLLQFLEDNGIEAVAFKGPLLAVTAYGNLALRQFTDLDVLVKERDFVKAKTLFLTHGYQPWRELSAREEAQHFQLNHAYTLVRSHDGLRLDLHWRITQERYAFGLDVESLWKRMETLLFCGRNLRSMSAEDLLIVLCLHGSKHCWERLAWICDVAELIRAKPQVDWDKIMSESESLNIDRPVLLGLRLAHDLLEAPVPSNVLIKTRKDRAVEILSRQLQRQLFLEMPGKLGPIEKTAMLLRMRNRLLNKIPYLVYRFHIVFTPNERDFQALPLPVSLRFIYYPLRLVRLTAVYGSALVLSKLRAYLRM